MASNKSAFNYQTRLFFVIVIFTWILTFAFFSMQYMGERENKIANINAKLQMLDKQILNIYDGDSVINPMLIHQLIGNDSIRITILNLNGEVLYDTSVEKYYDNHRQRVEIKNALNSGSGYVVKRLSKTDNKEYFYSAKKGQNIIVRSAIPYSSSILKNLRIDMHNVSLIIIIAIVLSIIAYFATRRLGLSIKNLRDFADQAEKGNINNYNTDSFPNDELGEISSHIINIYKNKEQAALDRDENLKHYINEEKDKTRLKYQLTSNINHELKTPIQAIQGCLETVINNIEVLDKDKIADLTQKSYDNIIRLSALMHDITTIINMTDSASQIEQKETNINDILVSIRNDIKLLPIEKQMRLNILVPNDISVTGNKGLLEAIFRNLVNNSIAYSGGRDIFIKLADESDDSYTFEVWDNGIGIEEEHIQHIFERFYRVDTGRSRKLGGTGLGLSIVKNAVIFHNGTIKAENVHQGGLKFTFTLHK